MPSTKIIFGCGYLGQRVMRRWLDGGDRVYAVSRSPQRAEAYSRDGAVGLTADVTRPETLADLPEADCLLLAVGFDRSAGGDMHEVYAGGAANVLAALGKKATQAIYISTTGVYGSADGDWVDEQTPPAPHRDGGRASLAAEKLLTDHPLGRRSAILRLAGIYGPGRVPYLDQLRAGEPIAAPSNGWLNLIHVDDAAAIVVAVDHWLAGRPANDGPHIFCVSDGAPVARVDYYTEAARLIGAPPPRFTEPPVDSPTAARAAVNRRVRSDKLRDVLGTPLAYPSYREGLASILES